MAWQLIYTSAPRSLEAGRSGFGTVARHRAISPLLAAALERASQFSRQPGADADRVIYSYRIVAIAGGRFHVLSSIRDAGADYTGRTNHLAHHLVVDPREIAQLGPGGPSPADILLGMPWTTSWTDQPRYLEGTDEVHLGGFAPMIHGTPWQQVTGRAGQGWLLASGEASRGAYVIRPAGIDLREIFGESLRLNPERLWQISFTTSLQPSDEPADFRWIGIEEHSPLRSQTETSGRPVFNLAAPATLPVIEAPAPVATTPLPPPSYIAPLPALSAAGQPAIATGTSSLPGRPPSSFVPETAGPPPAARASGGRNLWIAGGAGVAVILALIAIVVSRFVMPAVQEHKDEDEARSAIENEIHESQYFAGPREIPDLHGKLAQLHLADLNKLKVLTQSADRMLEAMRAADFAKMRQAEQDYTRTRHDGASPGLLVFPQFDDLAQTLRNATQLESELASINVPQEDYAAFRKLQEKAGTVDAALGKNYVPDGVRMKAQLNELANRKLAAALHTLLQGATKPAQNAVWFDQALASVKPATDDEETKKILARVRQIVADWRFVDAQNPNQPATALETRYRSQSKDGIWPTWLNGMAESRISIARPPEPAATAPHAPLPNAPLKSVPAETNPPASSLALYFLSDDHKFPVELPVRGPGFQYFLHRNDRSDDELKPFMNDVSKGLGDYGEFFKIQDGKLNVGAKAPLPPYVFVGKREGSEVFRLYVGLGRDDKPIFGVADGGLHREGDELVLDLARLPGAVAQPLFLRVPAGFGARGTKIAVLEVHALRCNIARSVQELKEQVDKLAGSAGTIDDPATVTDDNAIRAQVRALSDKPKVKGEKKPAGAKGGIAPPDEAPIDVGANRPAEMLAALLEKRWDIQTGVKPNPVDDVRAELAKKNDQADWPGLLNKLKSAFNYVHGQMDGNSRYDKPLAWLDGVDKLAERVCALEAKRQAAQRNATAAQTRAAKAAEDARSLAAHPLLHGKVPPGVYTLLVGDGDRKLPLIDFKIP